MACVTCHSQSFRFLFEKNNYRIEKCSTCNLVQVTNIPDNQHIEQNYDEQFFATYYKGVENNPTKQRYAYLNSHNKLDQIERRITRRGNLLDVGCSFGLFLDAARQRGWSVAGIELSAYAARYATEGLGLTVVNKPLTEAKFEGESFDVITMWYVIEHLPNPIECLRHLKTFLKEDGILVISTPNVDSYRAKIEGRRWRIWIPPEHLLYFSPESLSSVVEQSELEIMDKETALPYEQYFRKALLYGLINRMRLSDNVVYYMRRTSVAYGNAGTQNKK